MKSTIMKINIMLLGCFLSVAIVNAQGPSAIDNNTKQASTETKATYGKYTGHWFIKSGDEFFLVRSGNLPPGLVKKTTDNKVEDIDVEGVKKAVNFRKETHFNGKPIDNYYFVIEEEGEHNTALYTPDVNNAKNGDDNSIAEIKQDGINTDPLSINKADDKIKDGVNKLTNTTAYTDPRICVIAKCNGYSNWDCSSIIVYNPCSSNGGGICAGYSLVNGTAYYVVCSSTN